MKKALPIYVLALIGLFSLLPLRSSSVSAQRADPTVPGPLSVTREEYDFGDTAFTPTGFPAVELRGSVHCRTTGREVLCR